MAFNGSGTFNRLYDWTDDRDAGTKILATRMDAEMDGFATGLSTCITKDGQTTITADIPFSSNKITGLAAGSAAGHSVRFEQVMKNMKGSDVASAANLEVGDETFFDVTGTTTITSIDNADATQQVGSTIILQFDGILTLTHHATDLILPGGANITTAAGDVAMFTKYAAGDWVCISYQRADGSPVANSFNVVDDTTPQLGGDLDINGNGIAFTGATVTDVTGADTTLVSGTAGTASDLAIWNGDGDLVDGPTPPTGTIVGTTDTQTLTNKTLGATTLSGAITGADQTVSAINLKDYGEVTNAIGSIGGGTQDIDLTAGNVVTGTVDTSTTTFTFSNPTASDEGCGFTLVLTNGGSQTVNWPASVDWAGGTAPTLTTSGVDVLEFFTVDGGTTWYGFAAGLDMQ